MICDWSPIHHPVHLETLVEEAFVKKEHLVAIFFHFMNTYNTTWKYGIMIDMRKGTMPASISNFLDDRHFQLQTTFFLDPKEQEMCFPQGNILSVKLFNIKINIIKNINAWTDCTLYVENFLNCYRSKYMYTIEHQHQIYLNKIKKWATENGFIF